ncbi:MAG: family 43 glycosylhydrolase [Flavisolibacter sp.]
MGRFFSVISLLLLFYVSNAQRLVLRGDYPDPSVVKIADEYWTTATTSNWAPAYPFMKSKDLVNWKTVTHVFPKLPEWADYYFWAPEISFDKGKVYVYYAAHKKGGNLCIGVASADKPGGPYTDHGPLMCQEVGSIDAFPMRDENGKLYLIWKEDANSVGRPTPIWAMEMNEERTKLVGEKKELFRNDTPWESNLVEGVSMIKQGEYFYAFYAGAGCCGAACSYGVGVARSKSLLGSWEKYKNNPVLTNTTGWTCPGHGTPVEKDGRHYFMFHAYDRQSNIYTGRQGLLTEYKFTGDGWIEFVKDNSPVDVPIKNTSENFRGKKLPSDWQWSVFQQPQYKMKWGELYLSAFSSPSGAFLAHKTITGNYTATTKLHIKKSTASPGLAIIGDESNMISVVYSNDSLKLMQLKAGKETVIVGTTLTSSKKMYLQAQVANGHDISFYYGKDKNHLLQLNTSPVNGSYLPPWDRAIRIGLISKGEVGRKAVFDSFELISQ